MGSSLFDLTGKVAIVTGAGTGIGRTLALGLAEHGASVVVASRSARPDGVAEEIVGHGVKSLAVQANVCRPEDVDRLVEATVERFGGIDILINNAGGSDGKFGPTETLPFEYWQHVIDQNVTSNFLCSQRAGQVMIRQGRGGRIINIASIYGFVGQDTSLYDPFPDGNPRESLAYIAAKGAVVNMTRGLAVLWARYGINVNAIAPGMIRTERAARALSPGTAERLANRTPLKRLGTPEDIKGAAIYLASPAADFVTGEILAVDGGWLAW